MSCSRRSTQECFMQGSLVCSLFLLLVYYVVRVLELAVIGDS